MKSLLKLTNEELENLAIKYKQKEIAELYNVCPSTVSNQFKIRNLKWPRHTRQILNINHTYFDNIDTEEKAYFLGFFIADGCVKKISYKTKDSYRISFDNTIEDKESILKLHNIICPGSSLRLKHVGSNNKPQYTLQWSSDHMANTLINKYHIGLRKTHDGNFKLPEGVIPDHLWRHFIRGFMDGDGHLDNNVLYFVFTSKPFMEQIMESFKHFNYTIYTIKGKTLSNYWRATIPIWDGKFKCALRDFLYKDATIFLKRKWDRFNTEITSNLNNRVLEIVEHRAE